jgi:1,2-diacylglycerol 3-beta-glucosyltransferase
MKRTLSRGLALASGVTQGALWLPVGYLGVLAVLGLRRTDRGDLAPHPPTRFVVLIPGRDEASFVGTAIASVSAADYPGEQLRLIVVADNCTDDTAAVAAAAGAEVWERRHPGRRTKGAALEWALGRLLEHDDWDAVVLVDADAIVDGCLFRVLDARLRTAEVVQAERRVSNADENLLTRLSEISSAAQTSLRPRARESIGCAAKLVGTGMAFRRDVLERVPWRVEGLAEDYEYWLELLERGVKPVFEPHAVVADLMPTTSDAARRQRERWSTGRSDLARRAARRALALSVRRRDPVLFEAVVSELVFPTLSVTTALVLGVALLRRVAGGRGKGTATGFAQSAVVTGHVLAGLRAADAGASTYAALLAAPAVVVWKVAVVVRARARRSRVRWTSVRPTRRRSQVE